MSVRDLIINGRKFVTSNSPTILTATSVVGVAATAFFAGKGSFEAADLIREKETEEDKQLTGRDKFIKRAKLVWPCYIPAVVSGAATVVAIVGGSHIQSRRASAAATAFTITEAAFSEYREKVAQQFGDRKEKDIRTQIAQDHINKGNIVIVGGKGSVLCCERLTMRYFMSDMETLRKAQNRINHLQNHEYYVTMDQFYDELDLAHTTESNKLGWDSSKLMELEFSTILSPDGVPCIAFEYNYTKII